MTLGKQLVEQLKRLAQDGPAGASVLAQREGYLRLGAVFEGQSARLELADHDRYSVSLLALEVGAGAPSGDDTRAYLSARAAEVIRRLAYLEEPLAVWELDGGERVAQLRSSPPLREDGAVSYWEVTLEAGERPAARIARYRWEPGMPEREVVHYPATFALVGRISDSLAAALADEL